MTEQSEKAPSDLIGFLDFYLVKKAPFQLPAEVREFLVKFGPWIMLVFLILSVPGLLILFGIGTTFMPYAGVGYAAGFTYLTIGVLAQMALQVMALPGLFSRKMSAWKLIFYAQLIGITFSLLAGAILGAVVGAAIGLYILFQIRPLYVN